MLFCCVGLFVRELSTERAAADEEPVSPRPRGSGEIRLAITIDDMPGSAALPDGYTHVRLMTELVSALRGHGVANATGFVIGERVVGSPDSRAVLEIWLQAGYELGNHTYWHRPLDQVSVPQFLDDLAQMDPIMKEVATWSGRAPRYFRYPYLEEGRTSEDRKLLTRTLAEYGYTSVRVALDFSDWAWADPYARCMRRGDSHALALLSRSYLENAGAYLAWSVAAAHRLGRPSLPQVLLLHANVATAQNLDALLSKYERAGVRYVSLAEALSDPAYTAEYPASGGNVLTLLGAATHRTLSPWLASPLNLLELACR